MSAEPLPLAPEEWDGLLADVDLVEPEPGEIVELFPDRPARTLLAAALELVGWGFPVIPLHTPHDGACSCHRGGCDSIGKHPRTMHGLLDATTDEAQVRRWWGMWPDANLGLVIPPGHVGLDFDVEDARTVLDGRQPA